MAASASGVHCRPTTDRQHRQIDLAELFHLWYELGVTSMVYFLPSNVSR